MFGEAKRAWQNWNYETYSLFCRVKISNQGLRKENRLFEALAEFAIFSNPMIRNFYEKPKTNTGKFSLLKKACRKGKLPYPHSAKEPLGGVAERGLRGGG